MQVSYTYGTLISDPRWFALVLFLYFLLLLLLFYFVVGFCFVLLLFGFFVCLFLCLLCWLDLYSYFHYTNPFFVCFVFCLFLVGWLVGWLDFSEASSLNVAQADLKITILLPQPPASEPHACLHLGLFMHQLSRINLLPSLRKQRTCRTIFKLLSHRRKGNTQLISSPIKTFLQHHTHSPES